MPDLTHEKFQILHRAEPLHTTATHCKHPHNNQNLVCTLLILQGEILVGAHSRGGGGDGGELVRGGKERGGGRIIIKCSVTMFDCHGD